MRDWTRLFRSGKGQGVYNAGKGTPANTIEQAARSAGLAFFNIEISGADGKEGLLHAASSALEFPPYFSLNWDSFDECLRDLEWHKSAGYVILVTGTAGFFGKYPGDFNTARDIFKSAAAFWKGEKTPFYIILA
jgi:hypothetical protein